MDVKGEISTIKNRNNKVEADKSWEISKTRKLIIAILTYFIVVIFFYAANLPSPWINASVPTLAFLLSTLTMPLYKKFWIKNIYGK